MVPPWIVAHAVGGPPAAAVAVPIVISATTTTTTNRDALRMKPSPFDGAVSPLAGRGRGDRAESRALMPPVVFTTRHSTGQPANKGSLGPRGSAARRFTAERGFIDPCPFF